ncbi:glycosyl hydrolase family 95 catalytic domain-containing protein [Paenibacillus sp.]|uniref:glycosyl hydrolase family 95 catalytic domain-containing protein n=1 Tax=Paenibacillus sp. TaxID=58172 RepID=UPI002D3ECED5|nr:hypothetical protein [Paenibacillus sp.]HZG55037.1 hypothetical protein [Paenibacillus sp.]
MPMHTKKEDWKPLERMPTHELRFDEAIRRWDEALPLGNGMVGCLIWGDGAPLRFSLDRGDVWDLRRAPETLDPGFTYREMVRLAREGDQEGLRKRFDDFYGDYPYPTKLPSGALEYRLAAPARRVVSRLPVATGVAEVRLADDEGEAVVRCFLHAENELGYLRIEGTGAAAAGELAVLPPDYAGKREQSYAEDMVVYGNLMQLGYPAADERAEDGMRWFEQQAAEGLAYAIVLAERRAADGAREAVFAVATNGAGDGWLAETKRRVAAALETGFEAALEAHAAWWARYWARSALSLPDEEAEFQWYWNNYLFASTSRKGCPPMPLQGVWTADDGKLPPWKGDYHHDLNVQLCYWHYPKANHLEEGESLLDFLWALRPEARKFASDFFEAPGINLPSVMTLDGAPMGGWPMYSFSIANQIWLCQCFDHYWLYTGDVDFLREKAYVYLSETAECIAAWLKPGPDGLLALPVSSSPEIYNNSLDAWLTPNSNYDLSLMRWLFGRLAELAVRLGYAEEAARWNGLLAQLPELAVNEAGVLMLSPDDTLTESHRHHAHLMAIYPLKLVQPDRSERERFIFDASIQDLEKYGRGLWTGYSYAWAAAIYAAGGNGEAALYHLQQMWRHMCSPNGFHVNGDFRHTGMSFFHYRPFTLEGNFAAVDALQEMLLRTDGETIRPLPALPRAWARGAVAFDDFRGEMGALVSIRAEGGALQAVRLYAERDGAYRLRNAFGAERLWIEGPEGGRIVETPRGGELVVALAVGEACLVRPAGEADR